jgi:phosphoglycolate phosphatase-like HAD superfamily hydrolase
MKVKHVKGIIWDLDGTLIDSFEIFEQIIADVIETSGHTMPTREYMLANFHGSLEETVQQILGLESAEEVDKVINIFLEKQDRHYASNLETHLFQDAVMLARQAAKQDIHQLIVTNRDHEGRGMGSPRAIVAATTLADCIHEVRSGDEVDFRKPDKRSVGDWMERHQLAPIEVVVIGDQFVDAQLALNIGARAILIKRNGDIPHLETLEDHEDVVIVDDLGMVELTR